MCVVLGVQMNISIQIFARFACKTSFVWANMTMAQAKQWKQQENYICIYLLLCPPLCLWHFR